MNSVYLHRLQQHINHHLGVGKHFINHSLKHEGTRWTTSHYQIDLYIDTRVNDLVILFREKRT